MPQESDVIEVLSDWPFPEPGAPEPQIRADDTKLSLRYSTRDNRIAVIGFPLVEIIKFGSPNDEALGGHPLMKNGLEFYAVHRVKKSSWIAELEEQNSIHPRHDKQRFLEGLHHYIFTFHDSTLELVAVEGEYWKPAIFLVDSEEEVQNVLL